MMSKTILALIWGDDHLNLNGGAWQFLSGPNIYFQLLVVLTEIKFILRIKYSTDFFYFLLFSGRPWLFIFYGTMARIFIFKLFGPEYLFTKSASPLPSESNGRPLMAHSKHFYETARRARRGQKLILCFREGRIRIFYSSRLKCPWRV
jgi:hypothetical protein